MKKKTTQQQELTNRQMDVGIVAQGVEQATPEERTPEQQLQPSKEEEEKEEEKRRKLLCLEFASISGSDLAVAQCYLAENDWDMQVCPRFSF